MACAVTLARDGVAHDWLYLRVYPGRLERLDSVIRLCIIPAVERARSLPGIDRWFFLRYLDERGYHLRLRFRGPTGSINLLQREIERLFGRTIDEISTDGKHSAKRLVPLPIPSLPSSEVGLETDLYEPEEDDYGGASGVGLAEVVFQCSSELTLRLLTDEPWRGASRTGPALSLMAAAAQLCITELGREDFWNRYATFWSGGDDGASKALRHSFAVGAAARSKAVAGECSYVMHQTPWRSLIADYVAALERFFAAGRPGDDARSCAQFIHLMNNRLGFLPIEEAYLAFLVKEVKGATGAQD